ncbi:endonuclease III [Candidatus Peregrinibacteria bacterium RIFOXYA2_FULL_33_7]|nr:MAG: endonuclease III [Candidatus Peregrinibacteria bacterium RIFOXYA2_FULL_33_7]
MLPSELTIRKQRAKIVFKELQKLVPDAKIALNFNNNFQLLVAVILSAQCTDKQVNKVTEKLFSLYPNIKNYLNISQEELENLIKSTGFYKNKAKNILAAAKIVSEKYKGEIPKTINEMIKIPGVGRKTANVVLGNAYGIVEGIAVDTHVIRLSRQFGLSNHTDPDKIEQDLMQIIPKKNWYKFTYMMIDYGRNFSNARNKNFKDPISIELHSATFKTAYPAMRDCVAYFEF